jgi:hypothetical protein
MRPMMALEGKLILYRWVFVIPELVAVNKNNMTFASVFRGEHTARSVFFCGKKMRRTSH